MYTVSKSVCKRIFQGILVLNIRNSEVNGFRISRKPQNVSQYDDILETRVAHNHMIVPSYKCTPNFSE